MMTVYLIRHPALTGIEGLCYGRLEVSVSEGEVARAAASVRAQLSSLTLRDAVIYSSPSTRCLGLACELAAPSEPTTCTELLEMDFGDWQGARWNSIDRAEIDAWAADVWGYRPGGGESATMVAARWKHWLEHMRVRGDETVIAITHAGVIRIALALATDVNRTSRLDGWIPFSSVHRLEA